MASKLTERQVAAWSDAIKRLNASDADVPADIVYWEVTYYDEARPGRGHAINATYSDGEMFAQIVMDVYGIANASWAHLEWVHADCDEECGCGPCEAERAESGAA